MREWSKSAMLAAVFPLLVGLTSAGSGGAAAMAQTPAQEKPGARPENRDRGWVPVKERIAMGVGEPTWVKEHGKVQPDVPRALAYQKGLGANLEKAPDWIDVVDTEGPEAFLGYVYVVVYLEYTPKEKAGSEGDRAAIRKLQDSVLSSLTAVDFRYWLRFPERPAIIGFVNDAGLKKLAENKDVRAVGLDDKPYPDLHQAQFYQQGSFSVNGELPRTGPQVVAALEKADEVYVVVTSRGRAPEHIETAQEFTAARNCHDTVLARLAASELNVIMLDLPGICYGWVTKSGLGKLAENTDVREVELPAPLPRLQGHGRKAQ
jgi:hypothetical protein